MRKADKNLIRFAALLTISVSVILCSSGKTNIHTDAAPEMLIAAAIPEQSAPLPEEITPNEKDVQLIAKTIYGEARGITSSMERAAVAWCILNRVDGTGWPDTIAEVVTQPGAFAGYSPSNPATDEFMTLARDVLVRWEEEKRQGGEAGRVLPADYTYFSGDGKHNYFRNKYKTTSYWSWTLKNPYEN